jgi:hypothetical protein
MEINRTRKRGFRFSLKALLIVITLTAIFLGNWTYRAGQQKKAVERITQQGGQVRYDYQSRGAKESQWPKWLRESIGEDYLRTVEEVSFDGDWGRDFSFSDRDAIALSDLPRLNRVSLRDTDVTTEGLEFLRSLHRLESFDLTSYPRRIGGDGSGLVYLRNNRSLLRLALVHAPRPNNGLAFLQGLTRLEYLNLFGMELKDDDLREVGSLRALQQLNVNRTPIGNDGLIHLIALTNLRQLYLGCPNVNSAGLEHVQRIKSLQELDLWGAPVDDSTLNTLSRFRNLTKLRFHGTKVSRDGIKTLRNLLPNCQIDAKPL